jgi:hypothetical protein
MTLTGTFKSILLVFVSVLIWNTSISALQFFGYGISLVGLTYYSLGWEQMVAITTGFSAWLRTVFGSPGMEARLSPGIRKALLAGLAVLVTVIMASGLLYSTGYGETVVQLASTR